MTGDAPRRLPPRVMGACMVLIVAVGCVPQPPGRATPSPATLAPASPTPEPPSPTPAVPSPTLVFRRPTATPQPTFFVYRVRTGDTITSIAREHETTARSIGYWNRATYPSLDPESSAYNPNDIRVGWTLLLLPGVEVDPDEVTPPPSDAAGSAEPGD